MSGPRWPAPTIAVDWNKPIEGMVCAAMWPTMSLGVRERWFDELYVWTEGFQASTMQRARIQLNGVRKSFALLEQERVRKIGVTLSFGTIERSLDLLTAQFDENRLLSHRIVVLLRGQFDRLRSPYRVQGFIDWMRSQLIPVGYRLTSPRIGMEMRTIDFLRPDFAKVGAPPSVRVEYWQDMLIEARSAGLNPDWLVVSGIDTEAQKTLAKEAGVAFAQGAAVKAAYDPPSTRRPATLPIEPLPQGGNETVAPATIPGTTSVL